MKQLNLFAECHPKPVKPKHGAQWKLFVDGASRKNPGLAGAGIYILKNDIVVFNKGFFLGNKTNNQAEYLALMLGIFFCKKQLDAVNDTLLIFSDSELLVKQLTGQYRVKNEQLKALQHLALELLKDISYSICHILRAYNQEADALANQGIDKKAKPPESFITFLNRHEISF